MLRILASPGDVLCLPEKGFRKHLVTTGVICHPVSRVPMVASHCVKQAKDRAKVKNQSVANHFVMSPAGSIKWVNAHKRKHGNGSRKSAGWC